MATKKKKSAIFSNNETKATGKNNLPVEKAMIEEAAIDVNSDQKETAAVEECSSTDVNIEPEISVNEENDYLKLEIEKYINEAEQLRKKIEELTIANAKLTADIDKYVIKLAELSAENYKLKHSTTNTPVNVPQKKSTRIQPNNTKRRVVHYSNNGYGTWN